MHLTTCNINVSVLVKLVRDRFSDRTEYGAIGLGAFLKTVPALDQGHLRVQPYLGQSVVTVSRCIATR